MNDDPWDLAVAAWRQGQLADARARCDQVIGRDPSHPGAWRLLGAIALQTRDLDVAVKALNRSLQLQPGQPATLVNLGVALRGLGRLQEALSCHDHALSLQPHLLEALCNRANVLSDLKRHDEALESCEQALRVRPDSAEALNNKGRALQSLGRADEALPCFDAALRLAPRMASAYNNRAVTLLALKRPAEALTASDSALEIDARYADAHNNRAIALKDLSRPDEALASWDRAVLLQPDSADAHANRGSLLLQLERATEALESFERALQLRLDDTTLLCRRGAALRRLGRLTDSLSSYDQALRIDRKSTLALQSKSEILTELGRYEEAITCLTELLTHAPDHDLAAGHLLYCRLHLCDWTQYEAQRTQLLDSIAHGARAVAPFWCLALTGSGATQLQCARVFAEHHRGHDALPRKPPRGRQHQKLRIGYLSADFRDHPVSRMLVGTWEQHDRSRFESCAISLSGKDDSALGQRVRAAFDHFEDASERSDEAVAELIRRLEIDILVDLAGLTTHMRPRVRALRAAPIQVNYLGHPGTLGADTDYIIGDGFVTPVGSESYYSEQVARIPACFQVSDDRRDGDHPRPTRLEAGLPPEATVLCSFNNHNKLTPALFGVWMRLLKRTENSVLWIAANHPTARANLSREASVRGIDPNRLVFAPNKPYTEHLARLPLADLFLDTWPFNGGSTANDALYCNVPLLTCTGEAFASRMAGSLLSALGLPELIARNLDEYESIAQTLLQEPQRLAELRSRLARPEGRRAVFDSSQTCRDLESAFTWMWRRRQRIPPDPAR